MLVISIVVPAWCRWRLCAADPHVSQKEVVIAAKFAVTIGVYKDLAAYRAAFEVGRCELGCNASQVITKMPIAPSIMVVNLVRITVLELGLPDGATTERVFAAAAANNLQKCPAEVGPALRLAYADQPNNDYIWIGMDPVPGLDGSPDVFNMGHDDIGRWLDATCANPAYHNSPETAWVFLDQ